jgi:hypothetical protein
MIKIKGELDIVLADSLTKTVKIRRHMHNLITLSGHAHVADQMSDGSEAQMGYMAVGIGSGQSQSSNALANELDRNALQSGPTQLSPPDDAKVQYVGFWDAGDATGAITEAGIFNAASNGTMLCYQSFPVINKGTNDQLTITWTVEFTS